jgi:ornithine carbamoyltransferase
MAPTSPLAAPARAGQPAAISAVALEASIALLKANALAGVNQPLLRGRNIGILCEESQRPEVFLLQRAATDLGARVSLVRSGLNEEDALLAVERTGRVLGRLYDTLICIDVAAQVVERLRQAAGIPAIADLAGEWIALRAMHPDMEGEGRYLLQALLVEACR